ncbi:MAG: DinB family protein [bacterium]
MPMSEKDQFISNWEREHQTTLRVLKNYPGDQGAWKPHEKSRTASELAWCVAGEEQVFVDGALKGQLDFGQFPEMPKTWNDILSAYDKSHNECVAKIKAASEADLSKPIPFPMGPGKMGEMRCLDALWGMLMDQIHHRGQFSVYLRMAGGKVPSIYGPSADEPWM